MQLAEAYLRSVAGSPAAPKGGESVAPGRATHSAPGQIVTVTDVLRKSGQEVFTRAHQLKRRQESLELALKPLLVERDRTASQRSSVISVTINLATEREAALRLTYQVRGPGWQPTYRATLEADKSTVLIERLALVAQNSGEDWGNVQLTLSTGQPGRATQGRLPGAWTLDVVAPPPQSVVAERAPMAMAPAATRAESRRLDEQLTMPTFDVSTLDKGFATEFAVPQRISVPSNGQRVTLTLGSHMAPVALITRTAPAVEQAAYLVAQMVRPSGVWPAGPASLY
ncbi:MAG TPA: DUF4139 domain-containing protein, partial [Rubrivivax sp.]|nr:DUF4139 domain-containing protein [Rubrivivax sp.]